VAEMRFIRRTANRTLSDRIRSQTNIKNLEVTPVINKVKNYRKNWLAHVEQMEEDRSPKSIVKYTPTNKRLRGRPRKKLTDTSKSYGNSASYTADRPLGLPQKKKKGKNDD
jgi:hypothetical protein